MNLQQSNFDLYKPTDMLGQPIVRNSIVVASTAGQRSHYPGIWVVRNVCYNTYTYNKVVSESISLSLEKITIDYYGNIEKIRKSQSPFSSTKNNTTGIYPCFKLIVLNGEAERILRDRMIKWLTDNKKDARDYV